VFLLTAVALDENGVAVGLLWTVVRSEQVNFSVVVRHRLHAVVSLGGRALESKS